MLRRLIWPFLALTTLVLSSSAETGLTPMPSNVIAVTAIPVMLDPSDPDRLELGSLIFESGWALESPSRDFGGISAMAVERGRILALTDQGLLVRMAAPKADGPGKAVLRELPAGCGKHWRKTDNDSESMTLDPAGRTAWIGLEWRNTLCRVHASPLATEAAIAPAAMARWPRTGGAEAMTRLADGRFLVFAERAFDARDPLTPLLLFEGDPTDAETPVVSMRYRPPMGYNAVDAAPLPDGRILVLNRRFTLPFAFRAILVVVDPATLAAGAIIEGKEVARFAPPVLADNFEALAVESTESGPVIWIASDDNFMILQRNLLLKFRLAD